MDTDTLQEKFNRSEEALRKLKEDIAELISDRIKELQKSKDYLITLIKEKEAVNIQNTEQEAKIVTLEENIETKKNSIRNIQQEQTETIQETKEKENSQIDDNKKLQLLIQEIDEMKTEMKNLENELERIKRSTEEYREKTPLLENQFSEEIDTQSREVEALSLDLKKTKKENGVLSFLLEESAEDLPEVEILADLMKNGRSTQDQLKKSLESKISPVLITRTIGRMVENGFLNHHSADESYSVK